MTFLFTKRIAAGIAALILLVQPLVARQVAAPAKPTPPAASASVSVNSDSRNDTQRFRSTRGFDNFNVDYR